MKKILTVLLIGAIFTIAFNSGCSKKTPSNAEQKSDLISQENTTINSTTLADKNSFLPKAINSNHIASVSNGTVNYNVEKIEFGEADKLQFFDNNHVVAYYDYEHTFGDVYNLDGTVYIESQRLIDEISPDENVEYFDYGEAHGNHTILNIRGPKSYLYDINNNKLTYLNGESASLLNDKYIMIAKKDSDDFTYTRTLMDLNLHTVIPDNTKYLVSEIIGDWVIIQDKVTGKYGIADFDLNPLIECKYYKIFGFDNIFDKNSEIDSGLENFIFYKDSNDIDYMLALTLNDDGSTDKFIIDKNLKEIKYSVNFYNINGMCFRPISQYNGKTYIVKYLDEYFSTNYYKKIFKKQLIDENENVIIDNALYISGYFNGYCLVSTLNDDESITMNLIDLEGNTIRTVHRDKINDYSNMISLPDENGYYLVREGDLYTIYDIENNKIFESGNDIKNLTILGKGLFGVNFTGATPHSGTYEDFIRVVQV